MKSAKADLVFQAAWHLSFLNNVTQLALNPKMKFKLRHGITYEKDALLLKIHEPKGNVSLDIIGKAVVLAFRLSGIQAMFPSIVTVRDIATSVSNIVHFKKWNPTKEDKLKFFKGEGLGTDSIYVSTDKKYHGNRKLSTVKKHVKTAIEKAESPIPDPSVIHISKFIKLMEGGPKWCRDVVDIELKFVKEELLETLKSMGSMLEKMDE